MKIRLSVVDDQQLVRKGIVSLLTKSALFDVVNEFNDGEDFVNYYKTNVTDKPDIVLLDYSMPHLDGLSVCKWLQKTNSTIKPIILSLFNDKMLIQLFIQHGARAFLAKTSPTDELITALKEVYCNNFYFNDYITNKMLIELVQQKKIKPTFKKGLSLTLREKEIAVLICKELSYKEIAEKLSISLRTVESHKTNILEKIGASKVTGLVVYATKKRWV